MKTLKNGGRVKYLSEYNKEVEKNNNEILSKLETLQNENQEWLL